MMTVVLLMKTIQLKAINLILEILKTSSEQNELTKILIKIRNNIILNLLKMK